jgi:branched-chain amino acid aminotransferase
MAYILLNDEFFLEEEAVIKANNRAFRYGDGLFESMRMCNGKLQFAELHADRLRLGMKALKIEGHAIIDSYFLSQKTIELVKKNKFTGNVRFRLSVFRNEGGFYTPENNKCGYLLEAMPLNENTYELNKKGLIVDVYDEITKPINKLANHKTSNALLYVMAGLYKKQHRLDEALLLNQNGFLCEGISANVFVVYQKQIYTPALSEGCIAGVMRSVILTLCKTNDIPVIEAQINPEILKEAEEVFMTNAVNGISWVMGYDKKRYFNEVTKSLSAKLNALI